MLQRQKKTYVYGTQETYVYGKRGLQALAFLRCTLGSMRSKDAQHRHKRNLSLRQNSPSIIGMLRYLSMSTNLVPCTSLFVYRKSGSSLGFWSIA